MLTLLQRFAAGRGLFGGSRRWTQIWILVMVIRLVQRIRRGRAQVAFSYTIEPGETLLIAGEGREPRILGGTLPD